MKRFILALLLLPLLVGCSNDEPFSPAQINGPSQKSLKRVELNSTYDVEKDFMRSFSCDFYFVDDNGNDVVDGNSPSTWPVTSTVFLDNCVDKTCDSEKTESAIISYNRKHNRIQYDSEKGLFGCHILAYGNHMAKSYAFLMYVNGCVDVIDVDYKYTWDGICGPGPYAEITDMRYNGASFYKDGMNLKSVTIRWNRDGSRSVISEKEE